MFHPVVLINLLLHALLSTVSALELPRGVPVARASFYQIGRPFKCLDGSGILSWHQSNDDYCDCADGSDEPGTSACKNGQFFCRDTRYKAVSLRSSFVNDGVCDCCDGSDEYLGRVTCESTCGILAAAVEQARALKREEVERGHAVFKEYIVQLKARKEAERVAAEQAERERLLKAEESPETSIPPEEVPSSTIPTEHPTVDLKENIEHEDSKSDMPLTEDHVEHDVPLEHAEEKLQSDDHEPEERNDGPTTESTPPVPVVEEHQPIDYGPEEAFRMLEDLSDCLEFTDRQYTYRLCAFKDVYQRDRDSSGRGTSLGRWSGWATNQEDTPPEQKYGLMHYKNGEVCWNGPQRSMKVYVHCGPENKITDVKEPSRCEYEMQLYTPAACFDDPETLLNRIHAEL